MCLQPHVMFAVHDGILSKPSNSETIDNPAVANGEISCADRNENERKTKEKYYTVYYEHRDEVTGEWRKLHNTELHALCSSPDIIRNIKSRRLRWEGHVARMGESRNVYRVLVGRPEGKRPLGRPRRRWEDNIKTDLREVGYDGRDWINLAQKKEHFLRTSGKELKKRLVKCFVWNVALYGAETWTLRRSEEKRIEAFEMWIWRRMERVKWTHRIRNEAVLKEWMKKE
ncbi:hypothetical protein ANN_16867 [Periplaneta americana]|uniref:Uncharacterized protein n=1 Tax=Periplaneta americana TaxID=6978 RepID=A0ABQ8SRA8_PERAM|nr:hypothetical protein ANN_16867 [Periplaneta americana]